MRERGVSINVVHVLALTSLNHHHHALPFTLPSPSCTSFPSITTSLHYCHPQCLSPPLSHTCIHFYSHHTSEKCSASPKQLSESVTSDTPTYCQPSGIRQASERASCFVPPLALPALPPFLGHVGASLLHASAFFPLAAVLLLPFPLLMLFSGVS